MNDWKPPEDIDKPIKIELTLSPIYLDAIDMAVASGLSENREAFIRQAINFWLRENDFSINYVKKD